MLGVRVIAPSRAYAARRAAQGEFPAVHIGTNYGRSSADRWVVALVGALYVGLPRIAGLDETWGRLARGDPWWLAAAAFLEAGSYAGYVVLFRGIFVRPGLSLGWRASYQITMAGVAATRVFAAAGAGGIALTAWAMSRSAWAT